MFLLIKEIEKISLNYKTLIFWGETNVVIHFVYFDGRTYVKRVLYIFVYMVTSGKIGLMKAIFGQ